MTQSRRRFPRFSQLDADRCNVEHHVHTRWTDGSGSVREALTAAAARRLRSIALTDHVRRDSGDWFSRFAAEIQAEQGRVPHLEVLVGCEAKALDVNGTLDASDEVLRACDIVLGSVHRWPDGQGGLVNFADVPVDEFAAIETTYALGLLKAAPIDVLAHPGGMFQRRHGAFPEGLMRTILEASLERGVAIEISSAYLPALGPFLSLCRDVDPYVSIGSDAHKLEDIGRCAALLTAALRAGACA